MKIDLLALFKLIDNESYVVIKPSSKLPDYDVGSDIDIFCYHTDKIAEKISGFLTDYVDEHSIISVTDSPAKMHVDFVINNEINFRFDLYKKLPKYKHISLKPAFFSSVIESAITVELSHNEVSAVVKVPSLTDDLILRYVEYHEYYAARPDKIKHIEYIQDKLSNSESVRVKMFDKLHYYTAFPKVAYRQKTLKERLIEKCEYYQSNLDKIKHLYATAGFAVLSRKIIQKIRN